MRFTDFALVGIPLFYFCFFVMLIVTGASAYFQYPTGKPLTGSMISGTGQINTISELGENLTLNNELKSQPFDDTNSSGVFSVFTVSGQAIGFIKNAINLELTLISLPLTNVAGDAGDAQGREDIKIFNKLFWALFILPSHLITSIAILFFVRSG